MSDTNNIFYKKLRSILFLDIETVSQTPSFETLDDRLKPHWEKKASYIRDETSVENLFFEKAAIYSEFGKIITIAVGFFFENNPGELMFRVRSFSGHEEDKILEEFKELIEKKFDQKNLLFCAHNGKEFDFPYICRRMLIHNIEIPRALNASGKKPWEVNFIDTLELWKFGDKKNYTSLDLLANLFNIPAGKNGFDGSKVNQTYYIEKDLEKIRKYCMNDVVMTAQLYLRLHHKPFVDTENIHYI